MQPIYLFDLASQRSQWLSVRQTAVAENIANANTPNYRARDVAPFAATLDQTEQLAMAATNPGHIALDASPTRTSVVQHAKAWDITSTSNDVSLEKELIKSGEVTRDYSLDTSIVKTFHRMWMASVKG